jgi:hypothetical protein
MTLTSTGPSGFHLKPLVAVFAAAVFAIAAFAVGLWVGTDTQPSTPAFVDAAAQVAAPEVAPSANLEAFEAGKLDDAPLPPPSPTVGAPGTQGVASEAPSANFDAFAAGKLDMELAAANPSVYYGTAEAVDRTTGNWAAFDAGKLDDASATQTVTIDVSSGNYGPLVAGKYDMEYAAANPGVTYVVVPKIADGTSANWAAFEAGKLDDTPAEPESASRPPAVTGGHQEF